MMKQRNMIAGVGLIVLALGYGYYTSILPARTLPNTPGPQFFPYIITALLLVFSAALLIQGLMAASAANQPRVDPATRVKIAALIGALAVYLIVLQPLGFILASIPFFAVLMVIYDERRPWMLAAGSIATTLIIYFLFRHAFTILLPRGILAEWVW